MRNVLCLLMMCLLCAWSSQATAVTVGSSGYTDNYSTDQYLTDAYSISAVTRNVTNQDLEISTGGAIIYAITRTDYASLGAVQFNASDAFSGDGSWIRFGTGSTVGNIAYNNVTNYFRAPNGGGLVRIQLPAGQATTYLGVQGMIAGHMDIDNLAISDNSSAFSALASKALKTGNTTWSMTKAAYMSENYKLIGGTHLNTAFSPAGSIDMLGNNDSITYRFGGNGKTITDGSISFGAHDWASGDGSWFAVDILDLAGNLVYRNNLTNLAGGATNNWSGTLDFATAGQSLASLIGKDGFDVKFWAANTSDQHRQLDSLSINVNAVPEPASMLLLSIGGLSLLRRRNVK